MTEAEQFRAGGAGAWRRRHGKERRAEGRRRSGAAVETTDGPLLDLTDAAVKRLHQDRQEARLGDAGRIERRPAVGRDLLRSDRGHERDAQRDGHQRRRQPRTRRRPRRSPPRPPKRKRPRAARSSRRRAPTAVATRSSEPSERTDDPVRMYLREMGSVELLSREGEIAIAKRIEAGREAMIAGLCESPLTFQAIIIWRDELNEGKILLRDIIDLEATYAGPDGKKPPKVDYTAPGAAAGAKSRCATGSRPRPRPQRRRKASKASAPDPPTSFDDEDDLENSVSLSAMEAELKPQRARDLRPHRRGLQEAAPAAGPERREQARRTRSLSPAQERKYKALKKEIVTDVKSLSLNQNRIDALVEQLYDINKRLIGLDVRLMRLAETHRVCREDFLQAITRTRSSIRSGSCASRSSARAAGRSSSRRTRRDQGHPLRDPVARARRRALRSRNSASSSRWCRRASARRVRPRRRWSRPISASSSRSPRNTPTAACSSST